ncbi:hypothetical protein GCM10007160_18310 [Litchfieldella qijiaojingensis]|uniref:Ig-like domain-containing protein n=1 Tax=Litchfieldella qijiaojingensis TaxID=980347 RepID=A0ABQ2YPI7_9GAMM|nr:hypothetical protein GCM10007160_18310 [Halomonas qijiaojingensis]
MATLSEPRATKHGYRWDYRHFHKESVTDTTTSPIRLPNEGIEAGVVVVPGTDAKVEYTFSSYDDIEGDTATWVTWSPGTVTAKTSATLPQAASGVRMTSTGTSSIEVSV